MAAIRRIEAEDFPAFIIIDDKGNDYFQELILWEEGESTFSVSSLD